MIASTEKIRCLIVDDSALMRAMIKQMLQSDPQIDVIDTAGSGPVAIKKIRELDPDVVTMDVEMPGMDGIALLREVMSDCPVPVIMVSSHTQAGAQKTLDAMQAGAVDYVPKPTGEKGSGLPEIASLLIGKVKNAASTNMTALWTMSAQTDAPPTPARPIVSTGHYDPHHVIAIGISCGGPATLADIFPSIPAGMSPILITQHMPPGFTKSFADRLNRLSKIKVKEAESGDEILAGQAYVAPGQSHMTLRRTGSKLVVALDQDPPVCGHRPSVDKLFRSVAQHCQSRCTGVIMTGMGNDGAEAIREIRNAGGITIAQDQSTCIVYGMPKAAVDMGNIDRVAPLKEIVPLICNIASGVDIRR